MTTADRIGKPRSSPRQIAYLKSLLKHNKDDLFWQPRACYKDPPKVVWESYGHLSEAVDALLNGDRELACRNIRSAELSELLDWAIPVMSVVQPDIIRWRPTDTVTRPPSQRVDSGKILPSTLEAMYRRDNWRCRFCGCPIIRPEARKALCDVLPDAIRWTGSYGDHAAFFVMSGVADHVQPHSRSGPTSLDNLVTACQVCNYGKGHAFVDEHGLIDPTSRPAFPARDVDGLERILSFPLVKRKEFVSPTPPVNLRVWSRFSHLLKPPSVTADDAVEDYPSSAQ